MFSKGRELYGLFEARNALREQGYVLVTEGYMDVVALAQLGFPNAVATLGTACTADHVQKLFRFTDSVVFSFDGDEAGRRAARKALDGALPYATDVRTVKFLFLPAEHDPDSYIREFGRDAFARFVSEAMPLRVFLIEPARGRLRPEHSRRTGAPGAQQCQAAVEPSCPKARSAPVAGRDRRAGAARHARTHGPLGSGEPIEADGRGRTAHGELPGAPGSRPARKAVKPADA